MPGYEANGWFGIEAPRGTPAEIVGKLNNEIGAGLEDSKFKARLLALGVEPRAMTAPEFKDFIIAEVDKWAKVIAFAGLNRSDPLIEPRDSSPMSVWLETLRMTVA